MSDFSNKVVLITGGTSGIGKACVKLLLEKNAKVAVIGNNKEKGMSLEKKLCNHDGTCTFYKCDVSKECEIKSTLDKVIEDYGKIDILVNNAGIYPPFSPLPETEINDWIKVYDTNIYGLVLMTKHALPFLIKSKGVILNTASVAGVESFTSGQGYAYAASKSAVIKFTKMIAKIYAKDVRINCICPGIVDTPLYLNLNKEKMIERIPSKKIAKPEDLAKIMIFLISEDSDYIYGASIVADGGLTL